MKQQKIKGILKKEIKKGKKKKEKKQKTLKDSSIITSS